MRGRSFDCIFFKEFRSWEADWQFVGVDGEVEEVEELEEAVHRLHVGIKREPPCRMYDSNFFKCLICVAALLGCLLIMG